MESINLTEKQKEKLLKETKYFSTGDYEFFDRYSGGSNGGYSFTYNGVYIDDCLCRSFNRIAKLTCTTWFMSHHKDFIMVYFYASFDKLPKSLQ